MDNGLSLIRYRAIPNHWWWLVVYNKHFKENRKVTYFPYICIDPWSGWTQWSIFLRRFFQFFRIMETVLNCQIPRPYLTYVAVTSVKDKCASKDLAYIFASPEVSINDGSYDWSFTSPCTRTENADNKFGDHLNVKTPYYKKIDSHYRDKTSRPSYLYNENTYTWEDCLYIKTWCFILKRVPDSSQFYDDTCLHNNL